MSENYIYIRVRNTTHLHTPDAKQNHQKFNEPVGHKPVKQNKKG